MSISEPSVVQAVAGHMKDDHLEDNLLLLQAHRAPEAPAAAMKDVDAVLGVESRPH